MCSPPHCGALLLAAGPHDEGADVTPGVQQGAMRVCGVFRSARGQAEDLAEGPVCVRGVHTGCAHNTMG
jgi:hypothetical protein